MLKFPPRLFPRLFRLNAQLAVLFLLGGCGYAGQGASAPSVIERSVPAMASAQLIIKFRPGTLRCGRADIAALSVAVGVRLDVVRAMSGDACVIRQWAANANELAAGQVKLKQHAAVEWVELDAVMRPS